MARMSDREKVEFVTRLAHHSFHMPTPLCHLILGFIAGHSTRSGLDSTYRDIVAHALKAGDADLVNQFVRFSTAMWPTWPNYDGKPWRPS